MSTTFKAVFDGEVFRPEEPTAMAPNTRVRITVEPAETDTRESSFLQTARSLELEGPADWSERFEEYLYGRTSS